MVNAGAARRVHCRQRDRSQSLATRASGYLLKDSTEPELELARAAVARGETYLSPRVSKQVVQAYLRPGRRGLLATTVSMSRPIAAALQSRPDNAYPAYSLPPTAYFPAPAGKPSSAFST